MKAPKNFKSLKYWLPLAVFASLTLGLWLGYGLRGLQQQRNGMGKMSEIMSLIDNYYVDSINIDSLVEKAIPAILRNLDPHTAYIAAKDLEGANMQLKGSFGGVGIQFNIFRDTVNIVEVINDGPADLAGLQSGDRIIAVDNKPFTGKEITETTVRETLRGQSETKVTLTVRRPGQFESKKFMVTRSAIPVNSVETQYMANENTGYLKVSSFGENTYHEFLQALVSLAAKGAENYVIDLRGNSGGYMETAILMANEFLNPGQEIVRTRGLHTPEDIIVADGRGSFKNAKAVILIDEMSASSSEIFAGALQDNDRALIVGRRSFGKGLVQKPFRFDDGSELRLTVQRYFTPSGRSIQKEYNPEDPEGYEYEIYERYRHGENLNADSIKLNKDLMFKTMSGRTVYGGGGIMPDRFIANDTTGITNYYIEVANAGLINDFSYEYCDINRNTLSKAQNIKALEKLLPSDEVILQSFVNYAKQKGIPARWYYIKLSRDLIVNQIKAWIARYSLGIPAFYQTANSHDKTVKAAIEALNNAEADFPINSKPEAN